MIGVNGIRKARLGDIRQGEVNEVVQGRQCKQYCGIVRTNNTVAVPAGIRHPLGSCGAMDAWD